MMGFVCIQQPKSVYIQSGKYGEGKSHDKKRIYEFYMDGMTGRHHFKVLGGPQYDYHCTAVI